MKTSRYSTCPQIKMTLSNSDVIAIVAILVGVVSTFIAGAVGKYGFEIFKRGFWKARSINIVGDFEPLVRFRGKDVIPITGDSASYQRLDRGRVRERGVNISIVGHFTGVYEGVLEVSGEFSGRGEIHNGLAYISYEIVDKGRGQRTFGTMLLYVQEWGDIFGYFCCKSIRVPGTTGAGIVVLRRAAAE